ncbi:MAG: hypothetical protein HGA97_05135 [Chlorobiaceae bacterium]|nr:hypothetical protein [Chlorobiaceae bacterium]
MANFSLYISGQTELGDVTEFFQKRLIGEGETPIAFFDGVFYESHQERVGNIVYQDYLIYSDKALYLWARGASKDYLDRFTLGAVSISSRNKDSAFATMNLKIRREGKEPVFVIFDMVEIREADMIVKLQTVVESTIEDYLGVNYRLEIPQDTAERIFQAARSVCPASLVSLPLESPQMPTPDAGIGYGQDLLEQYRASSGYSSPQSPNPYGAPYAERSRGGQGAPSAPRGGLESMLPTDPASLKRIADQIKNMVGDAPFKLRDQVMKDLQHVPGDLATVLTALNELLANIAGNPLAERFVMNAIRTAVVNDGVIGSLGKIIKMTGLGGGGKKSSRAPASEPARDDRTGSRPRNSPFQEEPEDDSTTIRRRKISVRDDEDHSAPDLFAGNDEPITSRENRQPVSRTTPPPEEGFDSGAGGRRKKLSVRMEDDNEIARKLMSYDESGSDNTPRSAVSSPLRESIPEDTSQRKKKLSIKAEQGSGAEAEIARKLMSYDESARGSVNSVSSSAVSISSEPDEFMITEMLKDSWPVETPVAPMLKKIRIMPEPEPEIEREPEVEAEPETPVAPMLKKIRIMPEPEPEIEREPEVEAEPEIPVAPMLKKIRIMPEPEPEIEREPEVEAEPEAPVAPMLKKIRIMPEPEPEIEREPEVKAEPEAPVAPMLKKIRIMADPEPEIAREPEVEAEPEVQAEVLIESLQIDIALEPEAGAADAETLIPEHVVFAALQEDEREVTTHDSGEYMTIESDDPVRGVASNVKKQEKQRHSSGKGGRSKRHGR